MMPAALVKILCCFFFTFDTDQIGSEDLNLKLNHGLPEILHWNSADQNGFLPYLGFDAASKIFPPIAKKIIVEPDRFASKLVKHSTLIRLPVGSQIRRQLDAQGKEIWNFPMDTQFVDLLHFRDIHETLLELRLIVRRADGTWAFGVYLPVKSGPSKNDRHFMLRLSDTKSLQRSYELYFHEGLIKVNMTHINPRGCTYCHDREDAVGIPEPYGFSLINFSNLASWRDTFESRFGYSPFLNIQDDRSFR